MTDTLVLSILAIFAFIAITLFAFNIGFEKGLKKSDKEINDFKKC